MRPNTNRAFWDFVVSALHVLHNTGGPAGGLGCQIGSLCGWPNVKDFDTYTLEDAFQNLKILFAALWFTF